MPKLDAVHRDNARPTEAEVVLKSDFRPFHLALIGGAAKLPHKLSALRKAGGPERVPF